jgi:hypothetical protein
MMEGLFDPTRFVHHFGHRREVAATASVLSSLSDKERVGGQFSKVFMPMI